MLCKVLLTMLHSKLYITNHCCSYPKVFRKFYTNLAKRRIKEGRESARGNHLKSWTSSSFKKLGIKDSAWLNNEPTNTINSYGIQEYQQLCPLKWKNIKMIIEERYLRRFLQTVVAFGASELMENSGNDFDRSICKHSKNLRRKRFLSCSVD